MYLFLGEKFGHIEKRFEGMDLRIDSLDDKFDREFRVVHDEINIINNRIGELDLKFSREFEDTQYILETIMDNAATKEDMSSMRSYLGMEMLEVS